MGNYLPIYKQIWTSKKFNKLNAEEKFIYIYLLTSPTTHNTGVFNILPKQISCDTEIKLENVEKAMKKLIEVGLVKYWASEDLIYIFKMFHFTRGTIKRQDILYKTTLRQEELIKNHEAWQLFKEDNLEFYQELKEFEESKRKEDKNGDI